MAELDQRAIVVSGEATVRRVPDLAVVSLAVMVSDRKTGPARDEANRRASAILARLREIGVPDADVQAPALTVQPTYDYGRGSPKLTGYQGTSMELADPEAASREALAAAVAVARSRAEALATAAGLKLGPPRRIEEEVDGPHIPFRGTAMLRAMDAESVPTEVAAGEIEISARLRAWFDLE